MKRFLLLLLASALCSSAAVADDQSPEDLIRSVAGNLLQKIGANEAQYRANPELLQDLVRTDLLPTMDVRYSARLILGRAGRGISDEQLTAFANTMSEVLISRYADGMLEYRNRDQLQVLPLRGELNEKAQRVRTRVRTENGTQIPVDYVFRKTDEGWKAFDVVVEGISYITTYRNQIMPQVQEAGIDAVTERLARGELKLSE
ncbi:MAG: ABC transporter substrate-binding protein [Xanthomonadales bacterium]|nr:ABC transporter substrate-binding protein [Xanthomonadales bacterium]